MAVQETGPSDGLTKVSTSSNFTGRGTVSSVLDLSSAVVAPGTLGVTGAFTASSTAHVVGATTLDATVTVAGATAADTTTSNFAQTVQTASRASVVGNNTGTFDTTSVGLNAFGVRGIVTATRSTTSSNFFQNFGLEAEASGASTNYGLYAQATGGSGSGAPGSGGQGSHTTGSTTNYGVYGTATSGSVNYSGYFDAGSFQVNGAATLGSTAHVVGAITADSTLSVASLATLTGGFTLGADSSAASHKITNLTNGSSAQDAAAFGQIGTAVSAAVSGTSGRSARFTATNVVGTGALTDDGTNITASAGTVQFSSTLGVTGAFTASSTAHVVGALTVDGSFTLGDASGDSGVVNSSLTRFNATASADPYFNANTLNASYSTNGTDALYFNYYGYQGGTTKFRDTFIGDGKSAQVAYFTGSTKAVEFNGPATFDTTAHVVGALTVDGNSTLGDATTDATTVNGPLTEVPAATGYGIKSSRAASAGTTAPELVQAFHTGTYNTTGGVVQIYAGDFQSTATRSSGENNLINTALYLDAHGAQENYDIYSVAGTMLHAGAIHGQATLAIDGVSTLSGGFSLGADSSAASHKITNLTNGSSAQDAAAFGQIGTAVNTAVSGTSGRSARFTATNVVGTGAFTDDGTNVTASAGTVQFSSTLGVTGALTASSTAHIVGAATLDSTLTVTGVVSLGSSSAGTTINGTLTCGQFIGTVIAPAAITGTTNDWNPTGLATATVIDLATSGAVTLTGLAGGTTGRIIIFTYTGATNNVAFTHEDTGSTAANRFRLPAGLTQTLYKNNYWAGGTGTETYSIAFVYLNSRWEMFARNGVTFPQMEVITDLYQYGAFHGGTSGTSWTVTAAGAAQFGSTLGCTGAFTASSTGSFGGAVNLNSHLINNVTDPSAAQDAATKNYVDTKKGLYLGSQTLSSSSGTYTPTSGTKRVVVRMVGGGGAGGGINNTAAGIASAAGGNSGWYFEKLIDPSATVTGGAYACGAAGTGGTGNGGTGGDSTIVVNGTTYTAKGGTGGNLMSHTAGNNIVIPIAPASGTSAGDLVTMDNGLVGLAMDGNAAVSGHGGSSPFGAGGAGRTSSGNGNAATGNGAGGGGATDGAAATKTGGAGTIGIIIVDEYI